MVFAHHSVFACHGFWLPNDGRGSWSTEVWAPHLKPFGEATKTTARRSLANKPHDRAARRAAKEALIYPAVVLDEHQRACVARGFAEVIETLHLVVYACAIMPDHVHFVTKRHPKHIEDIIGFLKRGATRPSPTKLFIHFKVTSTAPTASPAPGSIVLEPIHR
jgi:hypothetical protein